MERPAAVRHAVQQRPDQRGFLRDGQLHRRVRSVAGRLPDGVTLVDAPVRGSVPEATAGRLAIYVGATATDYERVAHILSPLGTVG